MDEHEIRSRQFITLDDVQVVLSISRSQAYALVRSGDLRALRVGGRGQWRVELTELDAYIERCYQETIAGSSELSKPTHYSLPPRILSIRHSLALLTDSPTSILKSSLDWASLFIFDAPVNSTS